MLCVEWVSHNTTCKWAWKRRPFLKEPTFKCNLSLQTVWSYALLLIGKHSGNIRMLIEMKMVVLWLSLWDLNKRVQRMLVRFPGIVLLTNLLFKILLVLDNFQHGFGLVDVFFRCQPFRSPIKYLLYLTAIFANPCCIPVNTVDGHFSVFCCVIVFCCVTEGTLCYDKSLHPRWMLTGWIRYWLRHDIL